MTLDEIRELPDEAKMPPFTGTLAFINDPRGKVQTAKLKLADGNLVQLTCISRPPISMALKGKTLTVVGGIKSTDRYKPENPVLQVKLLPRGSFDTEGSESPAPAKPSPEPEPTKPVPHVNGYDHSSGNGQRAGMAVKGALDQIIAEYKKGDRELAFFGSAEFAVVLHRYASDIARVSDRIQKGDLAPTAKERDKLIEAAKELFTNPEPADDDDYPTIQ